MIKMLFIDDDAILRRAISETIDWESVGISLIGTAGSCVEALDLIADNEPDVIVTDIVMPQISGLDLCKIINREYPATKVILLSGYERFDYAQEAIDQQVFAYLTKPLKNKELVDAVLRAAKGSDKKITEDQEKEIKESFVDLKNAICCLDPNWKDCLSSCVEISKNHSIPLQTIQLQSIRLIEDLSRFCDDKNPPDMDEPLKDIMAMKKTDQIFVLLEKNCQTLWLRICEDSKNRRKTLIDHALKKLEDNYADPDLSLSMLAEELNVSYTYLSELFRTELNENFQHCLLRIRIESAKKLLELSTLKAYQVAERVGYNNQYYFSSCFKRYTGMTVSEYRQSHKTDATI